LFIEFLGRAKASAGELRAQTYVALDAGYLTQSEFEILQNSVAKCSSQASNLSWYLKRRQNGVAETGEIYIDRESG
jgi:four helix bundle protein